MLASLTTATSTLAVFPVPDEIIIPFAPVIPTKAWPKMFAVLFVPANVIYPPSFTIAELYEPVMPIPYPASTVIVATYTVAFVPFPITSMFAPFPFIVA